MCTKERQQGNMDNVHVEPCRPSKGFKHFPNGAPKCFWGHTPFSLSIWCMNCYFQLDCLYLLTHSHLHAAVCSRSAPYGRIKFLGPQWLKLTSHPICLKFGDMGVWISRACFLFTWHFIFLSMIFITSSSPPSSTPTSTYQ